MSHHHLDPHARPPDDIKDLYKHYQKLKGEALLEDPDLLDLQRDYDSLVRLGELSVERIEEAFKAFDDGQTLVSTTNISPCPIYTHEAMPGNISSISFQYHFHLVTISTSSSEFFSI